jgi:UDP-2-acetamido-2,6-beta-L-arabino-hexul-4-ose reductase
MKKILIAGIDGFIGKNLYARLRGRKDIIILKLRSDDKLESLHSALQQCDWIFHLAGVNRPKLDSEFEIINTGLTQTIVEYLLEIQRTPSIVFSSSAQATKNTPYGISKKRSEELLINYSEQSSAKVFLNRFPGVFGKWCKPNYNSVVATFCYNISHNLDVTINDKDKSLSLIYIDEIIDSWIDLLKNNNSIHEKEKFFYQSGKIYHIKLGELAETISKFREIRENLFIPDLNNQLTKYLYSTYLSYLSEDDFAYQLSSKADDRGNLTELFKSQHFGQVFISSTKSGIVRGNHYHHTKVEKFCVIKGTASIKLRHILSKKVLNYEVSGGNIKIVDIPPGYTHSIENTSHEELITLFWANEPFSHQKPDTDYDKVEE